MITLRSVTANNGSGAAVSGAVSDGLQDREFAKFRDLIFRVAGISMTPAKKPLVAGRLHKRLRHHGLNSYAEYLVLIDQFPDEMQIAIDLLTTNETHFFREPKHFEFLRHQLLPRHFAQESGRNALRIWSAASSSGQEAYSLAMLLNEVVAQEQWEIFGSDISTRVLEQARAGVYSIDQAHEIPDPYLQACCLRGVGSQAGNFAIDPALKSRVAFAHINLNETLPDVGRFDVIFLRNVLIYFQPETKREVINRLLEKLRPGGHFIVGHSESLNGIAPGLQTIAASIYRKP